MNQPFTKFYCFVADVANGVHRLGTDTLKVMLSTVAPSVNNRVKADISEISPGNGYAVGGNVLAIASSSQSGGVYKLAQNGVVSWSAAGTGFLFRYAILYNATTINGNLIGYWDFGSTVAIAGGVTFQVTPDVANGILQLA